MADLAKIPNAGSGDGLSQLLALLNTQAFGSGKTTTSESTKTEGSADQSVQDLLASILQGADPDQMKALVDGIYRQSKAAFGGNIMESIAAGNRAYTDTTLAQMQGDQIAKATQAAASAVLEAQKNANQQAVQLATARLNNAPKTTTQTKATGATPVGTFTGAGLLALQGYKALKDSGIIKGPKVLSPQTQADAIKSSLQIQGDSTPAPDGSSLVGTAPDASGNINTSINYFPSSSDPAGIYDLNIGTSLDTGLGQYANILGLDLSQNPTDILSSGVETATDISAPEVIGEAGTALDVSSDVGSNASDIFDEMFGGFFAEGGLVGDENPRAPKAYGSPNIVTSNAPTLATTVPDPTLVANKPITGGKPLKTATTYDEDGNPVSDAESGTGGNSSLTNQSPQAFALSAGQIAAMLGFVMAPSPFSLANMALSGFTGKGLLSNALDVGKGLISSVTEGTPADIPSPLGESAKAAGLDLNQTEDPIASIIGFGTPYSGPEQAPAPVEDATPTPITGDVSTSDFGGFTGDVGTEASGDSGFGDAGTGEFSEGGKIKAPGDGTVDTKMIAVADGEFVINAKAVKAIGADKLEWLNSLFKEAA